MGSSLREARGAIRPELSNDFEPLDDLAAKIAFPELRGIAELGDETIGPEQGNSGRTLRRPTSPDEPDVEVEVSGRVGQRLDYRQIDRDRVLLDFSPKLF